MKKLLQKKFLQKKIVQMSQMGIRQKNLHLIQTALLLYIFCIPDIADKG